jgi:uncharacterized membrane protein YagU involved in acid resistance
MLFSRCFFIGWKAYIHLTNSWVSWHVWQYGGRIEKLFADEPTPIIGLFLHLAWAWILAVLLIVVLRKIASRAPVLMGAALGATYYLLVNALALPMYFGDPLPWEQGLSYVVQPLIVLVSFGACVAYMSRRFLLLHHTPN